MAIKSTASVAIILAVIIFMYALPTILGWTAAGDPWSGYYSSIAGGIMTLAAAWLAYHAVTKQINEAKDGDERRVFIDKSHEITDLTNQLIWMRDQATNVLNTYERKRSQSEQIFISDYSGTSIGFSTFCAHIAKYTATANTMRTSLAIKIKDTFKLIFDLHALQNKICNATPPHNHRSTQPEMNLAHEFETKLGSLVRDANAAIDAVNARRREVMSD